MGPNRTRLMILIACLTVTAAFVLYRVAWHVPIPG